MHAIRSTTVPSVISRVFERVQGKQRPDTSCLHLGVSFHAVEPDELDVEASQRQAVLGLAYPGLLVEYLVLVGALYCETERPL